ncbi:insulinase family protein [Pedobacter miscanthi]|uniref:M16 family metallopeptidase n=1 Tax=Pedobacter miscanthi TaxID=2259170 RepID=UPI00292F744B|nr:insulinase family protein [Pedobacter miscanthi]
MKFYRNCFLGFLAFLCLGSPSEAQIIPLDQSVKTGVLPNGFTYYIKKNTEPAKRVQLYLVNNIGSILEDDDQQGLAHFMEHMNFNGTKNFPKNQLVDYLQKSGVRFGADLNAHTGFDETVYQLPLSTDDPGLLLNGIKIMRDWAQEATLDPEEIDKERGVILEEDRLRKGASERMSKKYMPMMLNNSRYALRFPIGTYEVLTKFQEPVIRRFLQDWYRPDLQALIVVGDVDPDQVESQIKASFSDLKALSPKRERINYKIPLTGKKQYMAVTDKEMAGTTLEIIYKHQAAELKTEADYLKLIKRSLLSQLISSRRYMEISRQDNPAYNNMSIGIQSFMGGLDMFVFEVSAKQGQVQQAFSQGFGFLEKIKRFGFTQKEFDQAKQSYLLNFENTLREQDKTASVNFVNEYKEHFLHGTAAPGIQWEADFVKRHIPEVQLSDIMAILNEYLNSADVDVLVLAPEKDQSTLPDSATVDAWIKAAGNMKVQPFVNEQVNAKLLAVLPKAGKITAEKRLPEMGITQLKLQNGISIILKPTTFKNDQILFKGFKAGGTSLYDDEQFDDAFNAGALISRFGLASFNPNQLKELLNGRSVNVVSNILSRSEVVTGSSSVADFETAMQVAYLQMTKPRVDSVLFKNIISSAKENLRAHQSDPVTNFTDTINAVLGNYVYRAMPSTPERLDKINLQQVWKIYRERFADASGFTFVFVGNFDPEKIKPLLAQYLGALPDLKQKHRAKDLGIHIPEGRITKKVYLGSENKASVRLVYSGDYPYSPQNNLFLKALADILHVKVLERLREAESEVYSPSVQASYVKYPQNRFSINVVFGCAPKNVDHLITGISEEMDKVLKGGITEVDIQKFKASYAKNVELALKDNSFWLNYLAGQIENNEPLPEVLDHSVILDKINAENLQQASKIFFDQKNLIKFILLPGQTKN